MNWGGLNPALTAWRQGINQRFPGRGTGTDGGYADAAHGSTSQHQPDADGTVDAFDCDVNFLGSGEPTGSVLERSIAAALKLDFQADPHGRSLLWIHRRQIANAEIRFWTPRAYTGDSPHTEHIHFQSRQSKERDSRPWRFIRTDALLREIQEEDMPTVREIVQGLLNTDLGAAGGGDTVGVALQSGYRNGQQALEELAEMKAQLAEIRALVEPPVVTLDSAAKAGRVKPGK